VRPIGREKSPLFVAALLPIAVGGCGGGSGQTSTSATTAGNPEREAPTQAGSEATTATKGQGQAGKDKSNHKGGSRGRADRGRGR
jgi:hypothetical protein